MTYKVLKAIKILIEQLLVNSDSFNRLDVILALPIATILYWLSLINQ